MSVAVEIDMIFSPAEVDRLAELEAVIERGKQTFIEVGAGLAEIRDGRLYRESHGTFESYCRERWAFTPQHAGRLMMASEVVRAVEPIGSIPANEAQARALAPLLEDPEALREAWAEASADGEPTAARIKEIVGRVGGRDLVEVRRPPDPYATTKIVLAQVKELGRLGTLWWMVDEFNVPPSKAKVELDRVDDAIRFLNAIRDRLSESA